MSSGWVILVCFYGGGGGGCCVLVLDIHIYFRDNNDEFGIDFENIMEEGAANGMNDDLDDDDAADDDD